MIAAGMLTAGALAPDVKADGHLTGTELVYAATFGTTAICPVITTFPTADGVLGVVDGITLDNFTQGDAFDIVGAAVWRFCPEHWPVVIDAFERSAAGPVVVAGAIGGRP
ncbi:hypothetical protein [Mycolicibacterium iranicum]|uniref:DUF732 domain-containing protein n=1 Tax=Mycolicibacterium iranicum TaxID=912594 RepID=A0A178M1W9_MYCIR|nr:hypothetical protein [Mycolicibacterium iranicum]OAN40840.1 hypothetical protein A4X20_30595 [Mycolicibacterium iranicum]